MLSRTSSAAAPRAGSTRTAREITTSAFRTRACAAGTALIGYPTITAPARSAGPATTARPTWTSAFPSRARTARIVRTRRWTWPSRSTPTRAAALLGFRAATVRSISTSACRTLAGRRRRCPASTGRTPSSAPASLATLAVSASHSVQYYGVSYNTMALITSGLRFNQKRASSRSTPARWARTTATRPSRTAPTPARRFSSARAIGLRRGHLHGQTAVAPAPAPALGPSPMRKGVQTPPSTR